MPALVRQSYANPRLSMADPRRNAGLQTLFLRLDLVHVQRPRLVSRTFHNTFAEKRLSDESHQEAKAGCAVV